MLSSLIKLNSFFYAFVENTKLDQKEHLPKSTPLRTDQCVIVCMNLCMRVWTMRKPGYICKDARVFLYTKKENIKKENIPLNGNIRTDLTRMYVVLFLMLSVGEHYGAFG